MKKIFVLLSVAVFFLLGMTSVSAASSSLISGVPFTSGTISSGPGKATDGDLKTSMSIRYRGSATLVLPAESDITGLYAVGSSTLRVYLNDSANRRVGYFTLGYSTDDKIKLQSGVVKTIPVIKNVKYLVIGVDDGNDGILQEVELYGNYILARPIGLNFVADVRSVKIDFDPVPGVSGYWLYVNGVKTTRLDTNSYILKNQTPDVPLSLQLSAIHGDLESPLTDPIIRVPMGDTVKPDLKAVPNWNVVNLSWKAIDGARNWTVYRDGKAIYTRTETYQSYADTSVKPETEYIYQLRYTDKYGRVVDSDSVKVKVPVKPDDVEPPEKPLGLTARMSADYLSIQVSWKPSPEPDLAGYNLYVSENGGEKKKLNKALMKQTSYALTTITSEHKYEFWLEAVDEVGNVSEPAAASITVPRKTTDSNQDNKPDYILVTWTKTEGATGYLIYLNGRQVGEVGPNVFEFKITRAMGYNPDALSNVTLVRAKFADGSIGDGNNGSKPGLPGGGWGIGGSDIWKNIVLLVGSLAGFILLGIIIKLVPRLIRLIYQSVKKQGSY